MYCIKVIWPPTWPVKRESRKRQESIEELMSFKLNAVS